MGHNHSHSGHDHHHPTDFGRAFAIGIALNMAFIAIEMFFHMAADAAISAGVVFAGVLISVTSISIIDPVVSFVVALIIFGGACGGFCRNR